MFCAAKMRGTIHTASRSVFGFVFMLCMTIMATSAHASPAMVTEANSGSASSAETPTADPALAHKFDELYAATREQVQRKRSKKVQANIKEMLALWPQLHRDEPFVLAQLHLWNGQSMLWDKFGRDAIGAHNEFIQARQLVGSVPYDHPPDVYFQSIAWLKSTSFALRQAGYSSHVSDDLLIPAAGMMRTEYCKQLVWDEQGFRKAADLGFNTRRGVWTIVIVYDLDETGKPVNVRLAAEAPSKRYGARLQKAMAQARAIITPDMPASCRVNRARAFGIYNY